MSPFRLPKSPVDLAWAEPLAKPASQPPSPVSGTLAVSRCDSHRARVLSYAIGANPDAAHQPPLVCFHSGGILLSFLSPLSFFLLFFFFYPPCRTRCPNNPSLAMSADPSLPKLIVLLLLYWLRAVSLPFAPARPPPPPPLRCLCCDFAENLHK